MAAPRGFPRRLSLLRQEWEVHYAAELDHAFGLCSDDKRLILIAADQSPESMADTLTHEVIHAYDAMLRIGLSEEQTVLLAVAWLDYQRGNKPVGGGK